MDNACTTTRAELEAHFPESVRSEIETCGSGNLREIATTWQKLEAEQAEIYKESGDLAKALTLFEFALRLDPSNKTLVNSMRDTRAKVEEGRLHEAEALSASGDRDNALKILRDALAVDPDSALIKEALITITRDATLAAVRSKARLNDDPGAIVELQKLLAIDPSVKLEEVTANYPRLAWGLTRGRVLAWLAFAGEALVVLGLLCWLVAKFYRRFHDKPILMLEQFAQIDLAPGLDHAVLGALCDFTSTDRSLPLERGPVKPLESTPLPTDFMKALPTQLSWLQAVLGLLDQILPRRKCPVGGALHKESQRGVGATIWCTTASGVYLRQTFWQKDYGGSPAKNEGSEEASRTAPYYQLAEYIAIWLLFNLSKPGFSLFGATNWRSYAEFRVGVNTANKKQKIAAFSRALRLDDKLHAARLNLALAIEPERRRLVAEHLKTAAEQASLRDPTRYHARYVRAVRLYDAHKDAEALRETRLLLADIDKARSEYGLSWDIPRAETSRDAVLKRYLDFVFPIAATMEAALGLLTEHDVGAARARIAEAERDLDSPRLRYNLACACSLMTGVLTEPEDKKVYLTKGLDALALALWLMPDFGKWARQDRALKDLRTSEVVLDYDATPKRAGLIFAEVLARADAAATPTAFALEEVASIGAQATALAQHKIRTEDELLMACETATQRAQLAEKLKVDSASVLQWAQTVDMLRVVGIQHKEANLLNKAGIFSLTALQRRKPRELTDVLEACAKELNVDAPTFANVESWITQAAELPAKII